MRKSALVLILLLVPTIAMAQGTLTVSSVIGSVEWKPVSAARFAPLSVSTQVVRVGDQVRTGQGSQLVLTLPDSSYMVVAENSTLTIQDYWTPSVRSLVHLMIGKVRFYIQRLGGKPNPYGVQTPTALIAVRGTIFEVSVDEANITEVICFEGRVAVESLAVRDREVILDEGRKTIVPPGAAAVTPVAANEPLNKNRVIPVFRKDTVEPVMIGKNAPSIERMIRDNDRKNRTSDPLQGPNSRTTTDTQRAKPGTLKYPNQN